MAGDVGNPNHDPSTGRFTSASGLNKNNSTVLQRGGGRLKEAKRAAKRFVIGAAGIAAAGVGYALLQGVQRPIRKAGNKAASSVINVASAHASRVAAAYVPLAQHAIGKALSKTKTGASLSKAHKSIMSNAAKNQFRADNMSSVQSLYSANRTAPKKISAPRPSSTRLTSRSTGPAYSGPRPHFPKS